MGGDLRPSKPRILSRLRSLELMIRPGGVLSSRYPVVESDLKWILIAGRYNFYDFSLTFHRQSDSLLFFRYSQDVHLRMPHITFAHEEEGESEDLEATDLLEYEKVSGGDVGDS